MCRTITMYNCFVDWRKHYEQRYLKTDYGWSKGYLLDLNPWTLFQNEKAHRKCLPYLLLYTKFWKCCIILRSKKRLHHLCAAAIAIFSYLLSGDECKAVIKTLESKSPAITPSNGQHQTAGMFCQMSRKLHKITDHRTYSSAMYFLPAGSILLFQRFLPYDSKDIICDPVSYTHLTLPTIA